ncbi:MBL fold metallo-hydrolase [Halieaceae bacterium IMCC14734]|uniref:MBL fold metallo-hydrolase n=1 Tax=Candidatus Litorirhabdus singularis TaxID=2518993 RepID=A0ABT3TIB1_9GAMM|nr:MBL fold metallo-hydrolase [Candidatus Litorirhabdus singularis]MCX2981530.1 MBL fold metallo-hydrolase [Candidatus Litorirhabdus singularis]
MKSAHRANVLGSQRGLAIAKLLIVVAVIAVAAIWYLNNEGGELKQQAMIQAASIAGSVAEDMLDRADSERANQLHKVPISVEKINDFIFQARGIGNTHVITTSAGHVMFDTGLALQAARQLQELQKVLPEGEITHIITSHSHADHIGGVKFWQKPDTEIIAHHDFLEEQRYLKDLEPYFWSRNRLLFPFMPEQPPEAGMFAYGGVTPTITVQDWEVYRFEQGGVIFEVYGTPGAEGADNIVLWLPQHKILFSGDTFGPMFPQFPNVFTMRGEKVRKPVEYIRSLDLMIALQPEVIVPSHFSPVVGLENTVGGMQRMREAVDSVHAQVVAGMNAGKTLYQLMEEVRLPAGSELTQGHGKVSWAVKSIWEYYATWFHFESTTELYPVPTRAVYADVAVLAGVEALIQQAQNYRQQGSCVKALHVLEMALAAEPQRAAALSEQQSCLQELLQEALVLNNTYEVMWLEKQIELTTSALGFASGG